MRGTLDFLKTGISLSDGQCPYPGVGHPSNWDMVTAGSVSGTWGRGARTRCSLRALDGICVFKTGGWTGWLFSCFSAS